MAPGAMKAEALEAIPSVTRKAKGSRKGQAKDVGGGAGEGLGEGVGEGDGEPGIGMYGRGELVGVGDGGAHGGGTGSPPTLNEGHADGISLCGPA
jgi:hypothetical protein